jgi:hypothetical protein
MAPKGFKLAGRGRRQIKGSIGGGGGVRVRSKGRSGGGGGGGTTGGTPTPPGGGTPTPYVKDPKDPTLFRDKGGAFTTEGYVNVPGGRVFVRPGDTMSEAIGQGKGLIGMAKTERARGVGGAYTEGGYVKTNESGRFSVASVRAGDTRSEVINMARARAGRSLGTGTGRQRAASQQRSLVSFRAGERASSAPSARSTPSSPSRTSTRTSSAGSAPRAAAPRAAAPRGSAQPAAKASVASKAPAPVKRKSTTAMRAK